MKPAHVAIVLAAALAAAGPVGAQPLGRAELAPGVTFEVLRLAKLPGHEIVELRFAVANGSEHTVTLERLRIGTSLTVSEVQLVDFANATVYKIGEAGVERLASRYRDGGPLAPGERREFWAWYKAPPAGTTKLAVFVPGVPPVLDVPLSR
ncbi:MAG: hypothetical protein N2038_03815 [Geminicoccaceae bacterium]|nr:hypothetical protein [Geminicoccaceae bacterium]MCS7267716.1 hypothetical protein [Geminicoccaceae bacterium]MCX7629359.1 hypothetical protein [Geminicoccaceae bacterium]MDW8123559.1 hypothetical protein [Geminicoccaceae bacterium]MDW8339900.1 hypothetical protein [Geminicoccaceae bacterium]